MSRSFKKAKGTSIKRYIEAIKVEKGIKSIMENEESVTDVAYDVRHKSPGTFSNTFKKQTALTPKKYKQTSSYAYQFLNKWIKKKSIILHYANFTETANSFSIRIKYPDGYKPKITCMGFFREAMPKGEPVAGVASSDILEFTIENIPNGKYYLFMCEIMEDFSLLPALLMKAFAKRLKFTIRKKFY